MLLPNRHFSQDFFVVSRDEWNTMEDTGKSMNNALFTPQYAKRYLSG